MPGDPAPARMTPIRSPAGAGQSLPIWQPRRAPFPLPRTRDRVRVTCAKSC